MLKWLTIIAIVIAGFIVLLLCLGYMLKENKVTVTALKLKSEQEKLKNADTSLSKAVLIFVDNKKNKANIEIDNQESLERYKQIITQNLTCISSEQCTVINTKLKDLACVVPINKIGASLLEKAIKKKPLSITSIQNTCEQVELIKSVCKQNLCELVE